MKTRLNVSTLLTAYCGHKNNAFSLDVISITYKLGFVKKNVGRIMEQYRLFYPYLQRIRRTYELRSKPMKPGSGSFRPHGRQFLI